LVEHASVVHEDDKHFLSVLAYVHLLVLLV